MSILDLLGRVVEAKIKKVAMSKMNETEPTTIEFTLTARATAATVAALYEMQGETLIVATAQPNLFKSLSEERQQDGGELPDFDLDPGEVQ